MNAGAAFSVAGVVRSMAEGIAYAEKLIDTGAAERTLKRYIEVSNEAPEFDTVPTTPAQHREDEAIESVTDESR